jgi:hypothetical protein
LIVSNVVVTLGGVAFQDMEVPEHISFGGQQRISVQPLIGGGRVVQALGVDDGVIAFSGIFSGTGAVARAQLLDTARGLGAVLPLVWGGFFYSVIIRSFTAQYRKSNLIPFALSCTVVADPLADAASQVTQVAALVGQDLTLAVALSGQAGVSLAGLTAASVAGYAAVQAMIGNAIGQAGGVLVGNAATLGATGDPAAGTAALGGLVAASSRLAALGAMGGYVRRAAKNLIGELL